MPRFLAFSRPAKQTAFEKNFFTIFRNFEAHKRINSRCIIFNSFFVNFFWTKMWILEKKKNTFSHLLLSDLHSSVGSAARSSFNSPFSFCPLSTLLISKFHTHGGQIVRVRRSNFKTLTGIKCCIIMGRYFCLYFVDNINWSMSKLIANNNNNKRVNQDNCGQSY